MSYYVYLLAKKRNGTFYVGVTNNLVRRVYEHKLGLIKGFSYKYDIKILVYFEHFDNIHDAIRREKVIKKWKRIYKIRAIESINPNWRDLYFDIVSENDEFYITPSD